MPLLISYKCLTYIPYKKSVTAYDSYLKEQREKKQQNTEPESVSFNGITYDVNNNKVYLGEA